MKVEFIFVGTELLLGNIVNTNAFYLSNVCSSLGFVCYNQSVVGDNRERILETIEMSAKRSDIIILNGGLGPTEDDMTKECVCEYLNIKMNMDEDTKKAIEAYFEKKNMPLCDSNYKQALKPEGSMLLKNNNGTAPGFIIEKDGKIFILLPGPPIELENMTKDYVIPYLKTKSDGVINSVTVKMCGVCESEVENRLKDMIDRQTNPTIATYCKEGEVHVRVTAKAEDEKSAHKLLRPIVKEIKSRFGVNVYSTDDEATLESSVVDLLVANNLTVTTVESCTGGLLAGRLINVPGVSEVFKEGRITYSNKSKRKTLGIKKRIIAEHTAVSAEVAELMVKGASAFNKADVIVSVTGLAGPSSDSTNIPVGRVYIGCGVKGNVKVEEYNFAGNREKVRANAVTSALFMMRRCILEYLSESVNG